MFSPFGFRRRCPRRPKLASPPFPPVKSDILAPPSFCHAFNGSLRKVNLMLADREITPMRLRGKWCGFICRNVLQE
jgi:hypothetical protein